MNGEKFSIVNKTKGKLPRLPFAQMKDAALGADYELSLAFISDAESQELNKKWRGKDKIANVLSFPLSDAGGEIFISPANAKHECEEFGRTAENFIAFLFIHGLCHLKGMDHGDRMEKAEIALRKKFKI